MHPEDVQAASCHRSLSSREPRVEMRMPGTSCTGLCVAPDAIGSSHAPGADYKCRLFFAFVVQDLAQKSTVSVRRMNSD